MSLDDSSRYAGDIALEPRHQSSGDENPGYTMGRTSSNDKTISSLAPKAQNGNAQDDDPRGITYLTGLRFYAVSLMIMLTFFMVSVEVSVVTTTLVSMSDDIGGFDQVAWILSSYLLGYVGVVIIFAKLSDIFGRKQLMMVSMLFFIAFSAGCGAAQTMTQLIILRAFQGVGGGGCFGLNLIFISEMVPAPKYPQYSAFLGLAAALALGLGPIIGGGISTTTTWRWAFLMNLPASVVALALCLVAVPNGFPYHGKRTVSERKFQELSLKTCWDRLDVFGSALLFLATLGLTAGFEEAESRFPWNSAYVITLLTVSGVLWIATLFWERRVTLANRVKEPVLPWRFFTSRVVAGILLASMLMGGPFTIPLFIFPQRFELVNGLSSLQAGLRILPFTLSNPFASIVASTAQTKWRVPPIYVGMVGAALQIVGFALLSTSSSSSEIPKSLYGYQVLAGFGIGAVYQTTVILIPLTVQPGDSAVGLGAVTQFRMMGGAVILAISTSVFNGHINPGLRRMGINDIHELAGARIPSSVSDEAMERIDELRSVLSEGYNRQFLVLCICGAIQLIVLLLVWKKKQVVVPER